MPRNRLVVACSLGLVAATQNTAAQTRVPTPILQSSRAGTEKRRLTIDEASRNDRWLGLGVRDVRWAPDGSVVYFRWNTAPKTTDLPEADPWFKTDPEGRWVDRVPATDVDLIPAEQVTWNRAGSAAVWSAGGSLYLYDGSGAIRRVLTLSDGISQPHFADGDRRVEFVMGESLYAYDLDRGALGMVAQRTVAAPKQPTDAATHLAAQQRDLFPRMREADRVRAARDSVVRAHSERPRSIPIAAGTAIDAIQRSPDGRWLTFRATTPDSRRPPTKYVDYVTASGYSEVKDARSKVGEPRDQVRLGIVSADPSIKDDSLTIVWVDLPEAKGQRTFPHGPWWNPAGTHALVQFVGEHDRDWWLAELDLATGRARVLTTDHEENGWIGGPPVQSNYRQPAVLEWLSDDRYGFASERSGWSHLYIGDLAGTVRPLTQGEWEVRGAILSRDRTKWLLQTSRANPADDEVEILPAAGGTPEPVTNGAGRFAGVWSPNGRQLALVHSTTSALPDLYLAGVAPKTPARRITESGTEAFRRTQLVDPEIVSFSHPDGKPVWAALYRPAKMNAERAAVIHVHGGGYRQFAHRGWSVYGWGLHVGFLHYLLEAGYPVLDFDYRGGAGFGKAYRNDVTGAMGGKDVDGAVAAARYLVKTLGVDSTRIGIYGVSYGGFMTLMSLFRYPGVFAAGIARAPVTDWAHYSDEWTSRILGQPQTDTAAYRRSSPIYFAEGLKDHLLIEHGLVDDNVHFQDTARLVERLIELGKDFDVMYYPSEPHTVETESSRLDQSKRAIHYFDRYLRGKGGPQER